MPKRQKSDAGTDQTAGFAAEQREESGAGPGFDTGASSGTGATPELAGDTVMGDLDRERIAMRAYELYLERGGADGRAEEDWLAAEEELRNRSQRES